MGSGFSATNCAHRLEKLLKHEEAEIILISRTDYLLFYPLLIEGGTGGLEPRHTAVSIRSFLKRSTFRLGEVLEIELDKNSVRYQVGHQGPIQTIHYDHLIFALGSVATHPPVPGLREHALQMKSLSDAFVLNDRVIEMLEVANEIKDPAIRRGLLNFTIVGGNFTGIEAAGEINYFLRRAQKRYPNIQRLDVRVTLIEKEKRILNQLDADLARYAMKRMEKNGVRFRLQTLLKEIHADHVVMEHGETMNTNSVVWCAGFAPHPLIGKSGLPIGEGGYIQCENDMRVRGLRNVWAVGDSAINVDSSGHKYPQTAQHAMREGLHVAGNIWRTLDGRPTLPSNIKNRGQVAAIGYHAGVGKLMGIKFSGFPAWVLKRLIHWSKIPGFSRKVRIACDWFLDLFFSRDVVQLGIVPTPPTVPSASKSRRGQIVKVTD